VRLGDGREKEKKKFHKEERLYWRPWEIAGLEGGTERRRSRKFLESQTAGRMKFSLVWSIEE